MQQSNPVPEAPSPEETVLPVVAGLWMALALLLVLAALVGLATGNTLDQWVLDSFVKTTRDRNAPWVQGDLDGDGMSDLLWRNQKDGRLQVWCMDATRRRETRWLPDETPLDLVWQLAGVGDLTGDRRPDLLWLDTASRRLAFWELHTLERDKAGWVAESAVPAGGSPLGLADVDGSGTLDLLCWQAVSRQFFALLLQDLTQQGTVRVLGAQALPADAEPVAVLPRGTGAFDLYWKEEVAGTVQVRVWEVRGGRCKKTFTIKPKAPLPRPWNLVAFGDFGSDGFVDLLWHNRQTGHLLCWHVQENRCTGVEALYSGKGVPLEWVPCGPR